MKEKTASKGGSCIKNRKLSEDDTYGFRCQTEKKSEAEEGVLGERLVLLFYKKAIRFALEMLFPDGELVIRENVSFTG